MRSNHRFNLRFSTASLFDERNRWIYPRIERLEYRLEEDVRDEIHLRVNDIAYRFPSDNEAWRCETLERWRMCRSMYSPCSFRRYNRVESNWENARVFPEWPEVTVDDEISPEQMRGRSRWAGRRRILTTTNSHSWKIFVNSVHIESFKCFALDCVIWPEEKSKTSSLGNQRLISSHRLMNEHLPEKFENFEIVLTHRFTGFTRFDDITDEIRPLLRPFMFQNLDKQSARRVSVSSNVLFTWTRIISNLFK